METPPVRERIRIDGPDASPWFSTGRWRWHPRFWSGVRLEVEEIRVVFSFTAAADGFELPIKLARWREMADADRAAIQSYAWQVPTEARTWANDLPLILAGAALVLLAVSWLTGAY